MRVVHIALHHIPTDVRIFYKQCRTLAAAGHDVHIVTGGAEIEGRDGVSFHSVGDPIDVPSRPRGLRRVRLAAAHLGRLAGAYRIARGLGARVYQVHEPALIIVALLLKLRGARIVYDAHEDYREVARRIQRDRPVMGRALRAVYSLLEAMAERACDRIIAATPSIGERFEGAEIVYNYPLSSEIASRHGTPYGVREPSAIFTGGVSEIRGAREIVQAMGFVPESLQAKLIIVGKFKPVGLKSELSRERGWRSVQCHDWMPREDLGRLLAEVRMGLVLFHAVPNHTEALPNKLFEYMAAGLPLIASDFPLWRRIITDAGCGLLVDPGRPKAIAGAIRWLLEHSDEAEQMGTKGRDAVITMYNWDVEAVKLLDLYRKLEG